MKVVVVNVLLNNRRFVVDRLTYSKGQQADPTIGSTGTGTLANALRCTLPLPVSATAARIWLRFYLDPTSAVLQLRTLPLFHRSSPSRLITAARRPTSRVIVKKTSYRRQLESSHRNTVEPTPSNALDEHTIWAFEVRSMGRHSP